MILMTMLTITELRNLIENVNNLKIVNKINNQGNKEFELIIHEISNKLQMNLPVDNLENVIELLEKKIVELKNSPEYWNPLVYKKNAEENIMLVKETIDDIDFAERKVMICGRAIDTHPDFWPRFSTPTTNIDSNLYVIVDHDPGYKQYITRRGNYAICLIVHPYIPKKILELGGKIYWFSPDYMNYKIPKLSLGEVHRGNSGLAAINLASYLKAKFILLSGIRLSEKYEQFLLGKNLVFEQITQRGGKIFSLDGVIAEKLSFL
ncbi:MAG TPA: hypothetical protein VK431_00815, partial [Nitrosopumilaceae archaeon]|nr:hypothetical protein [Nitrosopumilaceae archaeon]